MPNRSIDRFLLCTGNTLVYLACVNDLFIVKYRPDSHLISRSIFAVFFFVYLLLFLLSRFVPNPFSKLFTFLTSFSLSVCLSLSIFSLPTNTITSAKDLLTFNSLLFLSIPCSFSATVMRLINHTTFQFIHLSELAELLGFSYGVYITAQSTALYYFIASFFLLIITLRLRAFHSFILLSLNLIYFFYYYTPYSYIACFCFLVRLIGRPIVELYFVSLTSLERWIELLHLSSPLRRSFQRLMIVIYCLLPIQSIFAIGHTVRLHDEWFVIVPMFVISVLAWFVFRSLTFSLLWMLSNKLIDCYLTMIQANAESGKHQISLIKLMASKGKYVRLRPPSSNVCRVHLGIRYFGLITWPILVCSTLLTMFIGLLHYDTCTSYSLVVFLLTIHFECLLLALVKQLTSIVGGSCIGYALVAPAFE
jgi:hypothetical protein